MQITIINISLILSIIGLMCIHLKKYKKEKNIKYTSKKVKVVSYYYDITPSKYFITGDKYRNFSYVKSFCREMNTSRKAIISMMYHKIKPLHIQLLGDE